MTITEEDNMRRINPKHMYRLSGGPLSGHEVRLSGSSTLTFVCKGQKGRYFATNQSNRVLTWEPVA